MRQRNAIDVGELIRHLRRNRIPYLVCCGIAIAISVLYTIAARPQFAVSGVYVFNPKEQQNPAMLLLKDRGGPLMVAKGVANSDGAYTYIAKLVDPKHPDPDLISKVLNVETDALSQQLSFRCDKFDTQKNFKIVRAGMDYLHSRARDLAFSTAGAQADEYEKTYKAREADLERAENDFRDYVKRMRTGPDPVAYFKHLEELEEEAGSARMAVTEARSLVTKSTQDGTSLPSGVPILEGLRERLVKEETELKMAAQQFGPEAPQYVLQSRRVEEARQALQDEAKKYLMSEHQDMDPTTAELVVKSQILDWQLARAKRLAKIAPDEALEFERRDREIKTLAQVVGDLRANYEENRAKASVEEIQFTLLDPPHTDFKPYNKGLAKAVALGLLVGGFIGYVLVRLGELRGGVTAPEPASATA